MSNLTPTTIPRIDIQSIHEYMGVPESPGAQKKYDVSKDFPCIKPPFPICQLTFIDERPMANGAPDSTGVIVTAIDHGSAIEMWTSFDFAKYMPMHAMRVPIDGIGKPISGAAFVVPDHMADHWESLVDKDDAEQEAQIWYTTAMLGLCFINTKGARLEAPTFSTRQQRRKYERSKQEFKVLKIEPIDQVIAMHRHGLATGKRVHIVRGHLKDCREHGVAGNPNAKGIYWWQPTVRGNKELGIVAKEYETGAVTQ